MKYILVFLTCFTIAGLAPVMADVPDDESKTPLHELREAVAKIRSYYSPDKDAVVGYRLAGFGRQMRLGITLGPGNWSPGGETQIGAVIIAVTPGSPADEAGLSAGDVVTGFNGEPLVDADQQNSDAWMDASRRLVELSRELEEGDKVTLEYQRDGSSHRVDLVAREVDFGPIIVQRLGDKRLGDGFQDYVPYVQPGGGRWFLHRAWLDMELVALNPELGEYFGAESGVLVVRGPEEDESLDLQSGDVILSIGDREVRRPEHALRILRSYEPKEELTVQIIRRGQSQTLTGTVPDSPIDFDFRWDFKVKDNWKPDDR